MKNNTEKIKSGYDVYRSVRTLEKFVQHTEDYVRDFVGDNEYVIDGDELGTNNFRGCVLSIKQKNGELLVNAGQEKDIPFRSLSVTDRVVIAKALADCFDTEINKQ